MDKINKLSIVTSPNRFIESNVPDIFIRSSQEFSSIQQKHGSSDKNGIKIGIEDSIFRPVYMSEFRKKLRQRDWNLGPRKVIGDSGNISYLPSPDSLFPEISYEEGDYIVSVSGEDGNDVEEFIGFMENDNNIDIEEVLNDSMKREIYFYNSSSKQVDILDQVATIDVLKYDSDIYTDSLSISNLISPLGSSPKVKVDLGIQYVKNLKSSGIKLYCYHSIFSIKSEEVENDILEGGWIEEINGDVQVEFLKGVVKVYPISSDINECIISNCTLTYGNIG